MFMKNKIKLINKNMKIKIYNYMLMKKNNKLIKKKH